MRKQFRDTVLELAEADELIALARSKKLSFTIGYSQRFNPKFAFVKRSIECSRIQGIIAFSHCPEPRRRRTTLEEPGNAP